MVVDRKSTFPAMAVAAAVRYVSDERRRRVDGRVWLQCRKGVKERDNADIRIRLGGNGGIGRIALAVG